MEERRFVAGPEDAGQRLDRCLARWMGISRRRATSAIEEGAVLVDGRPAPKGHLLRPGQEVLARVPTDLAPVPEDRPIRIPHEDEWLLVAEKPSGWPTHPLRAGETGTLANAVVAHAPSCSTASADPREGGAVHRLDTETSGLVLFAKQRAVWEEMRRAFTERRVHKEYLALVRGAAEGGSIRRPIVGASAGRSRVARPGEEGREALTEVEPIRSLEFPSGGLWTLVRCVIPTGVRHQIRVHLEAIGHPIAGDPLYGEARLPGLGRLFLHATALRFTHPATGRRLRIESPLPIELAEILGEPSR